ncbi:MAG: hypothetical protein QXD98_03460 [Candidatus Diapherotrites archaeon]
MSFEQQDLVKAAKLMKLIIQKYADHINEKERKTVGEIKAMINKDDLTIQSIATQFISESYSFPVNYPEACKKVFEFVRDKIDDFELDIGISYWLSPKDIVSVRFADDEDKAIFLCSLLYCLGDQNAEVVIVELDSSLPHAFVATTINEDFIILDPSQKTDFNEFLGKKPEVLEKYSYKNQKIKKFLYKFNNSNYEQFE